MFPLFSNPEFELENLLILSTFRNHAKWNPFKQHAYTAIESVPSMDYFTLLLRQICLTFAAIGVTFM